MDEISTLKRRIESLEQRGRRTARLAVVLAAVLAVIVLAAAARKPQQVLRARGLVITDDAGKPRIILGAPMRNASDDPKLTQAVGLAVLDAAGRLNVAVGAESPLVHADGTVAERFVAGSVGLTIYDPRSGGERGGMSAFLDGRATVCLDYAREKEAACMSVGPDDAYADVALNGTPNTAAFERVNMYVGADGAGVIKVLGSGEKTSGFILMSGMGPPKIAVYDEDREIGEIAWRPSAAD